MTESRHVRLFFLFRNNITHCFQFSSMNLTTVITIASLTLTSIAFYYLWLNQQQLAVEIQQLRVSQACFAPGGGDISEQHTAIRHRRHEMGDDDAVVNPQILRHRVAQIRSTTDLAHACGARTEEQSCSSEEEGGSSESSEDESGEEDSCDEENGTSEEEDEAEGGVGEECERGMSSSAAPDTTVAMNAEVSAPSSSTAAEVNLDAAVLEGNDMHSNPSHASELETPETLEATSVVQSCLEDATMDVVQKQIESMDWKDGHVQNKDEIVDASFIPSLTDLETTQLSLRHKTVKELKDFCQKRSIAITKSTGYKTKSELIDSILAMLQQQQTAIDKSTAEESVAVSSEESALSVE